MAKCKNSRSIVFCRVTPSNGQKYKENFKNLNKAAPAKRWCFAELCRAMGSGQRTPRSVTCWHLAYYSIFVYATLHICIFVYLYICMLPVTTYYDINLMYTIASCGQIEDTVFASTCFSMTCSIHNNRYSALELGWLCHICRYVAYGLICAHTSIIMGSNLLTKLKWMRQNLSQNWGQFCSG